MSLTIGQIIGVILIFIFIGFISISAFCSSEVKMGIVMLILAFTISGIALLGFNWYNTNTATGERNLKDYQSEMSQGLEREITITAEDGREIFHYEGKIDIETDHTNNYILFESEEHKRYIIYYGIQDTVTIIEK